MSPRKRNALVVSGILILIAAVAAAGLMTRAPTTVGDDPLPGTEASGGAASDDALYLVVTAGNVTYKPILLDQEDVLTLSQGEETVNLIHVTPRGVWMESSTCENQDCVEQGEVTAENRQSRILGNMIICLPNRVQLELFTSGELIAMGILTAEAPDESPSP